MTPPSRSSQHSAADATRRLDDGSHTGPTVRLAADPHEAPTTRAPEEDGVLVLGRYRLQRRLGAGGFGVVWRARDEKLERAVAVKVMPREEGPDGERRVAREAQAAARLNHPGIVALYELAADSHDVYLVSELVEGRTLAELSRAGGIADADVARIGVALCEALEHAHARGVIHRDVKPQNVMVLAEPAAGAGFAKLTDFGVAHLASGDPLTRTGDVVGTLAYMAPEQAEGSRVTGAADVYSLALTLYEAWTGENPVRAAGPAATARRLGRPLPPLRSYRRDLPPALCAAIDDALDVDPSVRPSARELRRELGAVVGSLSEEGGLAEPATQRRVGLATTGRRRPALRAVAGLGRLGAGLAAGGLVLAALEGLGPAPPFSPLAAAGAAALAVALLPRVGWIAAALGVCGWLASPTADAPGTALVLGLALAPVPFVLPRAGLLWSVPALAPLLGTVALAPAFPALAALAVGWGYSERHPGSAAWRRAALGAVGFVWLAAAELLTGRELLFGIPDGALARGSWGDSLSGAVHDAVGPLLTSPALAPLVIWAVFAAVLPLLVRGRWLALDALVAGGWAVGLVASHRALGSLLAATTQLGAARGAVAGAALGALAVVAAAGLAPVVEEASAHPAGAL